MARPFHRVRVVETRRPMGLPDRDGEPERGGLREGLSKLRRHPDLGRARGRAAALGGPDPLDRRTGRPSTDDTGGGGGRARRVARVMVRSRAGVVSMIWPFGRKPVAANEET